MVGQDEDRLERWVLAADLYRVALEKARDCCGCGAGSTEECAADLLTLGSDVQWTERVRQEARALLENKKQEGS